MTNQNKIKIYCIQCGDIDPIFEDITHDKLNRDCWGDILCPNCKMVIATMNSESEYKNVKITGDKL